MGNRTILSYIGKGQFFAESYAYLPNEPRLVDVVAYEFDIPFDRQQLADYLNLERSALSKELGKMQRDGLITVRKNHFKIHAH